MTDPTTAFTKMMPGFDFLQGLVKNAGAAVPGMGHWIAPTLDPEALDKRIQEFRTVQYWLEQNSRLVAATIQALEVQRMTLSTLKTMNVSMGDLTESLKIRLPDPPEPSAPAAAPNTPPGPDPASSSSQWKGSAEEPASAPASAAPETAAAPAVPPGVADPMQWWGALTRQFTEIATNALKPGTAEAAQQLASSMVQQGIAAASQNLTAATQAQRAAAAAAQSAATPPERATAPAAKTRPGLTAAEGRGAPRKAAARKTPSGRA